LHGFKLQIPDKRNIPMYLPSQLLSC
jgi:hypothetical protein